MKHRLERVRELLRRTLGELIERDIQFDGALVTVCEADITPDLKQAHIYVSVLGGDPEAALATLRRHRKELQFAVSRRVILKNTPRLNFHLDVSAERGVRIIQLLDEIPAPAPDPEEDEADPRERNP